MLPDKLQKSFIWGRSFLMAAAKADNHAGSLSVLGMEEASGEMPTPTFPGQTAVSV